MKIAISFPPLESSKGIPLLAQNRQFQWFTNPTYIYPMIPAYAASLLKREGYEVIWDDGIAEGMRYHAWKARMLKNRPDLVMIETKTPVVKRHWRIINELKSDFNALGHDAKIALVGDHATALPEESLRYSASDFVLKGGDYDFGLLDLVGHLKGEQELAPGWWRREGGSWDPTVEDERIGWSSGAFRDARFVNNGEMQDYRGHSLDDLPPIDRELTGWKQYAYKNGNFKRTPGTYMMSARDCWWGRCTFCSWTTTFPGKAFRTRSSEAALDEVGQLIELGVREIMEDSGSLPIGNWLDDFCTGMIARGYNRKVVMNCNMRINGIEKEQTWQLMKKAGFRLILFGLESANQTTLDRIHKNLKLEEIEPSLRACKMAGLEPHITAMVGYPWETQEDAQRTVGLAKHLFKEGLINTLQATIVIPYPGTPMYKQCKVEGLLNFEDYDRFDQREQVMNCALSSEDVKSLTQGLYKAFLTPSFLVRKVLGIRSLRDIRFLVKAGARVLGHLSDFGRG